MSAIWCGGKLGSAYYDASSAQLFMQMDILETPDFQFLKRCKYPSYFLYVGDPHAGGLLERRGGGDYNFLTRSMLN